MFDQKAWKLIEADLRNMLVAVSPLQIETPVIDELLEDIRAIAAEDYDSSMGSLFDFCAKVARRLYLAQMASSQPETDKAVLVAQDEPGLRRVGEQLSERGRLDKALAEDGVPLHVRRRRTRVWLKRQQGVLIKNIVGEEEVAVTRSTIQRDLRWLTEKGLL